MTDPIDRALDEIVRETCHMAVTMSVHDATLDEIIRAACIRARETDPRLAAVVKAMEMVLLEAPRNSGVWETVDGLRQLALARGEGGIDD